MSQPMISNVMRHTLAALGTVGVLGVGWALVYVTLRYPNISRWFVPALLTAISLASLYAIALSLIDMFTHRG